MLDGLGAVTPGTIYHIERAGIRELMRLGYLPGIGVINIFLHGMQRYGYHIGTLLTGFVRLIHRTLDIAVVMRIALLAQAIDLPVMVGGHAIDGHRTGHQTEFAAACGRINDQRLKGILLGFV